MLWIILIALIIIAIVIFYFYCMKRLPSEAQIKLITDIIFSLVLEAEKRLGRKTGQAKFALVVRDFMRECPAWLLKYVTAEGLTIWINEAVERMRKYLETNENAAQKFIEGDKQ